MTGFNERIESLEIRASESKLIADLATDPEARIRNTDLAKELKVEAADLKKARLAKG